MLSELGRNEEAVAAYNEAVRLDPQHVNAHYHKGNALYNLERYEDAIVAYNEAIRLNPEHANAHFNKGDALYKLGKA